MKCINRVARRATIGLVVAAVAAGAACSSPGGVRAETRAPRRDLDEHVGFVAHSARSGGGLPHLSYWGGAVLANVKVVVVTWGSGRYLTQVTRATAPNVATFFTAVTASPYVDWLREYNPKGVKIGRGSLGARTAITPALRNDGATIDDVANIRPELAAQIRAGHLPAPDANTLYALFFPAGRLITQAGHDSATGFCAYHNTMKFRRAVNVRYAVFPATAAGRNCGAATGFGNLTTAASHELAEAMTDPDIGLATQLGAPLAWYDRFNGEIADICAGNLATLIGADGRNYTVQKLWSNRRAACVAS